MFHSVFISYSHKDEDFAKRLYDALQNAGVRCWYAPHDMRSGKKLHEQIEGAIHQQDRLLLILSEASMSSEWVAHEISRARAREKEQNRQILFPIALTSMEAIRDWKCFDADVGKDSAREIREYYIPSFADWEEPGEFDKAFAKLLDDLRGPAG